MTVAGPVRDVGRPLDGIRVVDLTHVWSGPSAAKQLAALGAEVLKVEGPRRLDFLRGTGTADTASRYPDLDHGADPWNRNAWFNTVNTDKRDVVLDLKSATGIELLLDLVSRSHLVIANYRPGVLDRMGIGYEVMRARRPGVIVVEMTGYGSEGPMARMQAYGAQFDAMSGAAWLTGDGERPLLTGFALSDPVAGLAAASAAVSAIARWRRTGEGSYVEVMQRDAMVALHGEYVLAASVGDASTPGLNADELAFPHGLYALGDGTWIAIAVSDEPGWRGLLASVDAGTRRVLEAYGSHRHARESRSDVERALRQWLLAETGACRLAGVLQSHGVAAAPVNDGRGVHDDEGLRRSGFLQPLNHPRVGEHVYPGSPMVIDGQRLAPRRAAPYFDQDTDDVLRDICELTASEIDDLRRSGVVGAPPEYAVPDQLSAPDEQERHE